MLNLWRLGLALGLLVLVALASGLRGWGRSDYDLAVYFLSTYLVVLLGLQLYLARAPWSERIPLFTVLLDLAVVSGYHLTLVARDQAIVAVNTQIAFLAYFLIIAWAGVRSQSYLAGIMAAGTTLSYALVVALAVLWRDVAFSPAHPELGSFRWEAQAARLGLLAAVAWFVRFAVHLDVGDRDQALRDPLTGLFNRRHLTDYLAREIPRYLRRQSPLSLLLLDLDGFKAFNDTHGHLQGDTLLAQVAASLAVAVRESDVVTRFGGDEFVVVLPATAGEAARRIAWELTRIMPGGVGVSVGVACLGEHVRSLGQLLDAADRALFQAKRAGGGVAVV